MEREEYAIEIEHLTKRYGKARGVEDVNLKVKKGDIFGFLGPNGAGKSTTIRSILGLIRFQEGSARILGMDAVKQNTAILAKVGYMPSEAMFYPDMKVKDVIAFAADVRKKDCTEEAGRLCERLKVDTEKRIDQLSLGNRKKVSIVCAMQHRPELFIFDEPTSGLDPLMQAEFFSLIKEYHEQGTTCFLSSHVLSEIKEYCDQVAIIKEGRLICVDTVEDLLKTNSKHIRVICDGKKEEYHFNGNLDELFAGFAGHHIEDIVIEDARLEDIFMQYYQEDQV